MILDEAIERYTNNAEYERTHGSLQGCLEFRQLAEWLKDYKRLKEQESCDDCVNRNIVLDLMQMRLSAKELYMAVYGLPPVTPEQRTGRWIRVDKNKLKCSECEVVHLIAQYPNGKINWCPNCGTKMQEVDEK